MTIKIRACNGKQAMGGALVRVVKEGLFEKVTSKLRPE